MHRENTEYMSKQPSACDPRHLVERATTEEKNGNKPRRSVTVNIGESPLSWLHARGHLSDRQFLGGEQLRNDYEAAHIGPCITMRWENIPIHRTRKSAPVALEPSERILSAKDRFDAAMVVLGRDLADIAWRVICCGDGVSAAERAMGWPTRSGKLVLRIALDRLAEYYRIAG